MEILLCRASLGLGVLTISTPYHPSRSIVDFSTTMRVYSQVLDRCWLADDMHNSGAASHRPCALHKSPKVQGKWEKNMTSRAKGMRGRLRCWGKTRETLEGQRKVVGL